MTSITTDIAIIGTGIVGIATAYYLSKQHGLSDILLIDRDNPMSFTSAQSGENYRNWWPHPSMVSFTNRSIDLMEQIATDSQNQINMNRRGYALVTRESNIDEIISQLHAGLGDSADKLIRYHANASSNSYQPPLKPNWEGVPDGVDILQNPKLISDTFPSYADDVKTLIHIRRGGDISGQQLGMYMLEHMKPKGVKREIGEVKNIENNNGYTIELETATGMKQVKANRVVNAAGPFAKEIAQMLGVDLPIFNSLQQKIAFEDSKKAIPRNLPFTIDLDDQNIDWSEEDREMLQEDPEYRWLTERMPGAIHCRPDGGDNGTWVKLGWAYNDAKAKPSWEPALDDSFPEIVLRGAARLNPSLKAYYGQLTRKMHHYGGWYTMTEENWPLIGPMGVDGAFMNCAHSGFGTMAACAAGELCASWIADAEKPTYANQFSMQRYADTALMETLLKNNKGVL